MTNRGQQKPAIGRLNERRRILSGSAAIVIASSFSMSCSREGSTGTSEGPFVVVYCSVDETYARPILDQFAGQSGIGVRAVFDSEAGKTTGLINRIVAEARTGRPGADIFWSGELFGTMRLAKVGLLETWQPQSASDIPARFRGPAHRWTALAVRARVLAYDPKVTSPEEVPARWDQLAHADVAPRVALANPLFGTTRWHVAAMFAMWGPEQARSFLRNLHDRKAQVLDSNSATVRAVMDGRAQFAVTDSDDVYAAQRAGASVDFIYPDMGDGGTLLIPSSVALIQGGANLDTAKRLADFLVSADVERLLAQSESRNIPVRESLREELGMTWPAETKIEFSRIMDALEASDAAVREILIRQ